jgi:hypothetical protein
MAVAEKVKNRIDDYWLKGFYQYKSDNTILLKCDTLNVWLNNDQFYKDVVLGVDVLASRVAFELSGLSENIEKVRSALLNRICTNLTFFLEATNGKSPHFLVEYESKPPTVMVQQIEEKVEKFFEEIPVIESVPEVSIPQVTTKKKKESK